MTPTEPGRERGGRLAALALGILLLGLAEWTLRLAGYTYVVPGARFHFLGVPDDLDEAGSGSVLVRDARLFWRLRPGAAIIEDRANGGHINAAGFRGPLLPVERRRDVPRVVAMGDSSTYGSGQPYELTYVGLLRQRLESHLGGPVEVMDAGCPGYSSHQGLRLLESDVLSRRPDVVTLYFGAWNDFTPAFGGSDAHKAAESSGFGWGSAVVRAAERSRLFLAMHELTDRLVGPRGQPQLTPSDLQRYLAAFRAGRTPEGPRVTVAEFRDNLHAMVQLCRRHGATPVLLTPPLSRDSQARHPVFRAYRNAVREVGRSAGVRMVPAAGEMDRREAAGERVYADWVHPNRQGHAILADLTAVVVARALAARGTMAGGRPEP